MGPVNWIAVVAAWFVAALLGVAFYGRASTPRPPYLLHALAALLMFASAAMLGHMFARVGSETLETKWWLYFMMAGGLALTFIGPAIVITAVRRAEPIRRALFDWGFWLVAYLAMGGVFLLLG
ncbi:DUF1761 domain-containing protein [Qipengyuania flava]|uniref:DUF1761 domain-containing protein n=1 Tax=Qipengyuania TaxID=1855416 RepID=UPI001C86AD1A|nr:DUF1761 domain-containing protein [Qipengyuania aestuarii]MBX7535458.1 DUF1761 domain-containing protein [Qipengyuania aestuarii]MCA0978230.1 DUF1761 domain-containing protein [Qipengyuania flava]